MHNQDDADNDVHKEEKRRTLRKKERGKIKEKGKKRKENHSL